MTAQNSKKISDEQINHDAVYVKCSGCKKHFAVQPWDFLVSAKPSPDVKPVCPHCNAPQLVTTQEIGCPYCLNAFWIHARILGKAIQCPHCKNEIELPAQDQWQSLVSGIDNFNWLVVSSLTGETIQFYSIQELIEAITNKKVTGSDLCIQHKFAPPKKLREECDKHFSLRKLYDPRGAYSMQAGLITGCLFGLTYIIMAVKYALTNWDGGFLLLTILFGILAIILAPTVIGLIILYFIVTLGFHLPPWTLAALTIFFLMAAINGAIGYWLGIGVVALWTKFFGYERTRVVEWDEEPAITRKAARFSFISKLLRKKI